MIPLLAVALLGVACSLIFIAAWQRERERNIEARRVWDDLIPVLAHREAFLIDWIHRLQGEK